MDLRVKLRGDLIQKGYKGKTIGVKLRYADFKIVTRDTTLGLAIDDAESIRDAVRSCLKRVPLDNRLRLLGVRVAALVATEQANTLNAHSSAETFTRGQSLPLFE